MSNVTGDDGSFSSGEEVQKELQEKHFHGSASQSQPQPPPPARKKRNLPGTPGNFYLPINLNYIYFIDLVNFVG